MSGRRKHLEASRNQSIKPPEGAERVVRALGSRGDNLFEVESSDGSVSLALLPARFNKQIWIKRGAYLVVAEDRESVSRAAANPKRPTKQRIAATIEAILSADTIAEFKKKGCWPPEFSTRLEVCDAPEPSTCANEDDSEDDMPPLIPNTNRPVLDYNYDDDEDDSGIKPEGVEQHPGFARVR